MNEWPEIVAKLVVYSAALLSIGAVTLRVALAPLAADRDPAARRAVVAGSIRLLRGSSWALLVALLARMWAHTVTAFGFTQSLSWSTLEVVAIESRWGGGWRLQVAATLLLIAAAAWARREGRASRSIAAVAACLVALALPRTGHAATATTNWIVHSAHVLGAGVWVGTLACIVLLPGRGERRLPPELLRAFAPVAATGVVLIVASGLWAAWNYVGGFANLGTSYGRLLIAKVVAAAGAGLLGAVNWWRLRRSEAASIRSTVFAEAALATVVVLLTAWLTETAHP